MKKNVFFLLCLGLLLSGCSTRPLVLKSRIMEIDRVDQDLKNGNRGYISGRIPVSIKNKQRFVKKRKFIEFDVTSLFDPEV